MIREDVLGIRDGPMRLLDVQHRAWINKMAKGFNTTDAGQELLYLIREMGEALEAQLAGDRGRVADELADVTIFAVGVARITGAALPDVDLPAESYPDVLPPPATAIQRDLLLMFREGVKVSEAWHSNNLEAVTARLEGLLACVLRLARSNCIDLPAAVAEKLAVNEGRTYVRDETSGRLVKAVTQFSGGVRA